MVDTVVYAGVAIAFVVTLYPFLFVLSMSISDPVAVARREVFLLPKGFSLAAYRTVLSDPVVIRSYYNTIWYTGVGTALNLVFTVMAAYPLSKRNFSARGVLMFLIVFTMFFSGGLIPLFVLVVKVGLYGTRWAIVIPTLIATFNLIICRTFFQTLPEDLFESARIEGAGEWRIVWKIVLPLSKPIVAVLVLFYGIAHWNSFFPCLTLPAESRPAADPDLPAPGVDPGIAGGGAAVRDRRGGPGRHGDGADQVRGDDRGDVADPAAVSVFAEVFRQGSVDRSLERVDVVDTMAEGLVGGPIDNHRTTQDGTRGN